jgi:hypothetical protein
MNQSKIKPKVGDIVLIRCVIEGKGIAHDGHRIVDLKVMDSSGYDFRLSTRFTCYDDCLIAYDINKE